MAIMAEVRHKILPSDLQSRMHSHAAKMRSDRSLKTSSTEKVSNINYEADVKHALRYTRGYFSLIGIWSMVSGNPTEIEKNLSKFLIPICFLSSGFILIPPICYLITNEESLTAQLIIITPLAYFFGAFAKYVFIIFRCRMIKFCIEQVRVDWMMIDSEKGREIMKMNIKVGHDITVICSIFLYTCGFCFHTTMPLLSERAINEFNETVRPLVYPGYDRFYDSQTSPNYEITFFTIWMSAFVGYTVSNSVCNVTAIFVTHACGQVQILISRLGSLGEELNECDKNDSINERVPFIIRSHVKALRFASDIEIILAEMCFIEVFASVIIMCFLEYCFILELKELDVSRLFTYFSCIVSLTWNIYIYCHIGELLKEQFHKIGVAAYMVQWYRLPSKFGLDVMMIMVMASSPRQITAGNIMDLTMNSFANVMKTSMTYFNMLLKMTN